jgi:hypothetical protein
VDDEERAVAATERYLKAGHAMQSGVAMEMNYSDAHAPKHLRVGVNSAQVDTGGLAALLIRKGVISDVEYREAIADMMEAEAARYEERLSERLGRKITLG